MPPAAGAKSGEQTGFLAQAGAAARSARRRGLLFASPCRHRPSPSPALPPWVLSAALQGGHPGTRCRVPAGLCAEQPPPHPPGCRLLAERGDCSPPGGGGRPAPALCVAGLRAAGPALAPCPSPCPLPKAAACGHRLAAGLPPALRPRPGQDACSSAQGCRHGCREFAVLSPAVGFAPSPKAWASSEGAAARPKVPPGRHPGWLHPCASDASALKAPGFPPWCCSPSLPSILEISEA